MLRHINDVIGCSGFSSHHIFNWMHFGQRSGALVVFFERVGRRGCSGKEIRDRLVINFSFTYRISLLLLLAVITGILCTLRVSRDKLEISRQFDRYTCTLDTETRGCIAA